MPIGNLTSQIFANIYLNELDRFVKHTLKPQAYLRYGDDFIVAEQNLQKLQSYRQAAIDFLERTLQLKLHQNDIIIKPKQGLKFLSVILWPFGRMLNQRNKKRIIEKLQPTNVASYRGIVLHNGNRKKEIRKFDWLVQEKLLIL